VILFYFSLTFLTTLRCNAFSATLNSDIHVLMPLCFEIFVFKVEEACDLSTAEEMIRTIKVFSESSNHGSIVALAIMSHGDTNSGGIYGNDGSVFTVQEVVDALCSSNLKHIPKVLKDL